MSLIVIFKAFCLVLLSTLAAVLFLRTKKNSEVIEVSKKEFITLFCINGVILYLSYLTYIRYH